MRKVFCIPCNEFFKYQTEMYLASTSEEGSLYVCPKCNGAAFIQDAAWTEQEIDTGKKYIIPTQPYEPKVK